jgi:hypothetical protein
MRLNCCIPLLFTWMMAFAPAATADNLAMTPSSLVTTLQPGETWRVTGTVTNVSGADLFSTDLFLTFSGYPNGTLAPLQTLGSPDFLIPDRSISPTVELFSLGVLPGALSGSRYSFDVFAVSLQGDFSNVSTFVVAVVPEPSEMALMVTGLLALALRHIRRRAIGGGAVPHNA